MSLGDWTQGPTAPFLDKGMAWRKVTYRYRESFGDDWKLASIDMLTRNDAHARQRVQFLVKARRWQVDVMKVEETSKEGVLQTGKPVETVTKKEFENIAEKNQELLSENEAEIADELRGKGWYIP